MQPSTSRNTIPASPATDYVYGLLLRFEHASIYYCLSQEVKTTTLMPLLSAARFFSLSYLPQRQESGLGRRDLFWDYFAFKNFSLKERAWLMKIAVGLILFESFKAILSFSVVGRDQNVWGRVMDLNQLSCSSLYALHTNKKWLSDSINGPSPSLSHIWQVLLSSRSLETEYIPVSILRGRHPSLALASNLRW